MNNKKWWNHKCCQIFNNMKDIFPWKLKCLKYLQLTGRVEEKRRWSDSLHQAVEAKEGLKIQVCLYDVEAIFYIYVCLSVWLYPNCCEFIRLILLLWLKLHINRCLSSSQSFQGWRELRKLKYGCNVQIFLLLQCIFLVFFSCEIVPSSLCRKKNF